MRAVRVRVPGKLMLMGEYAVTQVGHPGIVTAIDRFLSCTIEPSAHYRLDFPNMGSPPVRAEQWDSLRQRLNDVPRLELVNRTLMLVGRYLREEGRNLPPFRLTVTSELQTASGIKYGFGSSAAVSVALVAALLRYATTADPEREAAFKLAAAAHLLTQGNGSCADIAAATHGGVIYYRRFDAAWLGRRLTGGSLHELVEDRWPGLRIERLPQGPASFLRVGWTGQPVPTPAFLERMAAFKDRSPAVFQRFLVQSDRAVEAFAEAMKSGNLGVLFRAIGDNRSALTMLASEARMPIETEAMRKALKTVERLGGKGKTSGSGGGDAIVAWFSTEDTTPTLRNQWKHDGMELMMVSPIEQGITYDQ